MDEIKRKQYHPFTHYVFVNSLIDTDDNEFAFFESIARDTGKWYSKHKLLHFGVYSGATTGKTITTPGFT